jgi:uncharacterized SAM-binding protein YcdF (DUF218 family)
MKKQHLRKLSTWITRVLLILLTGWLLMCLVLVGLIYYYGTVDGARSADAIVVLGAGLRSDGQPGWALTRRSSQGAERWKEGYAPYVLCTGGQAPSQWRSEAAACRELLLRFGVPDEAILLEERSRSTEENALNSREILDNRGWNRVLLVSDSYHMFRAGILFRLQGFEVSLSPVARERINYQSFYVYSVAREIAALHFYAVKEILRLPVTYLP